MSAGLKRRGSVLVAAGIILSAMLALVAMSALSSHAQESSVTNIAEQLQRQLDSGTDKLSDRT